MGASKSKRVIPFVTVPIVFNNKGVTTIDVAETATLADARKEVELAAKEFKDLPQDGKFLFLYKGLKCTLRKETTRMWRDAADSESRLTIVIGEQTKVVPVEETGGKEELLDKAEEAVDMADEVTGTITDQLTEETQQIQADGTISVESKLRFELDDASTNILKDLVDIAEAAASVVPAAKLVVMACKTIYDRCQEPSRLRAEILDFLHFIKDIESAIVSGLKNFQAKDPLLSIEKALKEASSLIEASQKRNGFEAWWCAKADRESLRESKDSILKAMDIAKFTMQVNIKEDLVNIMKKDAELYARINCQDKHTAVEKIAADDALKREILSHARLNEKEFNALREGQAQMLQKSRKDDEIVENI